jgi:hypothetical protein
MKGQAAVENLGSITLFLALALPLAIFAMVNSLTMSENSANYITYANLMKLKEYIQQAAVFCPSSITVVLHFPRIKNLTIANAGRNGVAVYIITATGNYGTQSVSFSLLNQKPVNVKANIKGPYDTLPLKITCKDEVSYYAINVERAGVR